MLPLLPFPIEVAVSPTFGHHVGSTVRQKVRFELPQGWRLEERRLPRPGPLTEGIEIRQIIPLRGGIEIDYQLFLPIRERYATQLPSLSLFFRDPEGTLFEYPLKPQPLLLSPLIPPDLPDREVVPRPLWKPPPVERAPLRNAFLLSAGATLLLGGGLFWHRRQSPSPLGEAALRIQKLLRRGADREAFLELHRALFRLAGFAVHRHNLERLFKSEPALEGLREELKRFFEDFEKILFAEETPTPEAKTRLLDLAHKLATLKPHLFEATRRPISLARKKGFATLTPHLFEEGRS